MFTFEAHTTPSCSKAQGSVCGVSDPYNLQANLKPSSYFGLLLLVLLCEYNIMHFVGTKVNRGDQKVRKIGPSQNSEPT